MRRIVAAAKWHSAVFADSRRGDDGSDFAILAARVEIAGSARTARELCAMRRRN
jgi:hypothetical protein